MAFVESGLYSEPLHWKIHFLTETGGLNRERVILFCVYSGT